MMRVILFILFFVTNIYSLQFSKVILNKCYGGISFSDSFEKIYEETYNKPFIKIYDPANDKKHTNKNIESRYDENLIKLIEKIGIKESAGKYSNLVFENVPSEALKYIYIDEYDGYETMSINISQMYKELLVDVMSKKIIKFSDVLQYNKICSLEKFLKENKKRVL